MLIISLSAVAGMHNLASSRSAIPAGEVIIEKNANAAGVGFGSSEKLRA